MTPKARQMRSSIEDRSISVDELFVAAFSKSKVYYQRESLWGWRPVTSDFESYLTAGEPRSSAEKPSSFTNSPDINVRETQDSILIEVDLPDIDEDSLYLEISGDLLIIRAERAGTDRENSGKNNDADQRMVHRYVKLPVTAKPGNVQARIDNNLLRIIIHKPWSGISERDASG